MSERNVMREAGKLIARGSMLGFGFAIAFVGIAYGAYVLEQRKQVDYVNGIVDATSQEGMRQDVVLSKVEEMRQPDGRVWVVGTLTNNGKQPTRGISVEVNLFKGDKFVDQYSTYVSGSVGPGESKYFKVACGCKDSPPADHDSFKAHVVGGY